MPVLSVPDLPVNVDFHLPHIQFSQSKLFWYACTGIKDRNVFPDDAQSSDSKSVFKKSDEFSSWEMAFGA